MKRAMDEFGKKSTNLMHAERWLPEKSRELSQKEDCIYESKEDGHREAAGAPNPFSQRGTRQPSHCCCSP